MKDKLYYDITYKREKLYYDITYKRENNSFFMMTGKKACKMANRIKK